MEIFDVSLGFDVDVEADVGIDGDFEVMGVTRSGTMGAVKGLSRSSTDDNDGNGGSDDDDDDDGNGTDDDDPPMGALNPLFTTLVLLRLLSL